MENCADCGKPIGRHEASYYRKGPADDIGQTFHSMCGDPFGIKAKDAEIERLRAVLEALVEKLELCHADKRYEAVWTLYHAHGGRYAGPTYTDELNAAKAATLKR